MNWKNTFNDLMFILFGNGRRALVTIFVALLLITPNFLLNTAITLGRIVMIFALIVIFFKWFKKEVKKKP